MTTIHVQRKIAPHPVGWPNAAEMDKAVALWEAPTGCCIPKSYRDFMVRYNGGRVFPALIEVAVPDAMWAAVDKQTWCDPFLNWDMAMERWNGEIFGESTPKGLFFVAEDGFGLDFLMSLRPQDHGKIYCWQRGQDVWGQPGNDDTQLYLQAEDFTDLFNQLYETPEEDAFSFWKRVNYDIIAQNLVLI